MWLKLDDGLLTHPKLYKAATDLQQKGYRNVLALALGWYTESLLYCAQHLTDGELTPDVVKTLHITPAGIAALVRAGLWVKTANGWRIHDFLDYNPTAKTVAEKRQKDRERHRAGGQHRPTAPTFARH
jgi:hypothetical protein